MLLPTDKVDVEYCYSGFLGYRLNIFLWHGKTLLGVVYQNEKGEFVLRPGLKNPDEKKPETKLLKFWFWLQRNVPRFLENL